MHLLTIVSSAALIASVHAKVCGSTGWSRNTDSYYYNDSDNQGSYTACSKQCLNSKDCKSFSFSTDVCELFSVAVDGNFDQDGSSPNHFYDRVCIVTTTTSQTSTSTSKTSATTSQTSTSTSKTSATTSQTSTSTSKTSVTTSKSSTATTLTSITAKASGTGVAIPPGCSNVPQQRTITSFAWFNSTHNCDCAASRPDVGNGTGCLDANGAWCDPDKVANCTHCDIPVCYTGLPNQPVGYGPPDTVNFAFADGFACEQDNPQGFKPREVGEGGMWCGGPSTQMSFVANSEATSSNGTVTVSQLIYCDNSQSYYANYVASFPIDCKHDVQRNATCTTPLKEINVPLISVG